MVSHSEFNLRSPSSSSSRCNYRPQRPPSAEGALQTLQSTVRAFSHCKEISPVVLWKNTTGQDKELSVLKRTAKSSAVSEEGFYSLRSVEEENVVKVSVVS